MTKQAAALRYAVRVPVVLKYLGQLCLVVSGLTLVPLGVSVFCGETDISLRYLIVIGGLAGSGGLLVQLRVPARLQVNEGMVLVALLFLIIPLVMAYPMMASGVHFLDALFEAISGSTTTGLSTLATVESAPTTFLFARAWMQWYGGLGIVILSLALVVEPGLAAKGLAATETETDDLVGGLRAHARRVLIIYSIGTGVGIVGLWCFGIGLFNAVVYAFAAVSTGGFAPHDDSLAGLGDWPVQGAVTLLCLLGASPLVVFHRVYQKKRRRDVNGLQLRALLLCGIVGTLLLGLCMGRAPATNAPHTLVHSALLAFSAQTTAGFATLNLAEVDAASKLILILAMAVGGGVGSTAGGLKLLRLLIVIRLLQMMLIRTGTTKHAVLAPQLANRRLQAGEIQEACLLVLLYGSVMLFSWLPFVALGYDPLDALFEVVSATGTAGLSVGITTAELPALLKGVLCFDMLLGRLEILAWLVLLSPGTWIGRRMEAR